MRGLNSAMKQRKYALIARKYNGSGYRQFNYDGQIEEQYKIAKSKKVNWSKIEAKMPPKKIKPVWIGDFVDKEINLSEKLYIEENKDIGNFTENEQQEQPDEFDQTQNTTEEVRSEISTSDFNPADTITIVTGDVQKYVPQDIQEQVKEGLITVVRARAYVWIQFL